MLQQQLQKDELIANGGKGNAGCLTAGHDPGGRYRQSGFGGRVPFETQRGRPRFFGACSAR